MKLFVTKKKQALSPAERSMFSELITNTLVVNIPKN